MIADLKPYPAYKATGVPWLGEVPEHWEIRRIKHVFRKIVGGATPPSGETVYWGGEVVWVTPVDVSRNAVLTRSTRSLTRAGLTACSAELVPPGSIVVTSRAPVGNVSLAAVELCTNQGCKALVPDGALTESAYGFSVLEVLHDELQSLATGTTFTEISTAKIGTVPLPLPPLDEQSTIMRFLDHADRRIRRYINTKRKLIALLNEQKQAIINRAVTRGLDPNVALKPSGVEWLGDVPEHWEVLRAKYLYREVDDRTPSGEEELLSVSHITGVTPRSQKTVTMFMAQSYVGHKACRTGDLVINTMWAWMGALGVAQQGGIVSPAYAVYRPLGDTALSPEYADLLLRTRPYVGEYVRQSTGIRSSRLRLYPEKFLRVPVLLPSALEQDAILAAVGKEMKELNEAEKTALGEIDLLREFRTRLIADVVTGRLDVRDAAAALPDEVDEPEELNEAELLTDGEDEELEDVAVEEDD